MRFFLTSSTQFYPELCLGFSERDSQPLLIECGSFLLQIDYYVLLENFRSAHFKNRGNKLHISKWDCLAFHLRSPGQNSQNFQRMIDINKFNPLKQFDMMHSCRPGGCPEHNKSSCIIVEVQYNSLLSIKHLGDFITHLYAVYKDAKQTNKEETPELQQMIKDIK